MTTKPEKSSNDSSRIILLNEDGSVRENLTDTEKHLMCVADALLIAGGKLYKNYRYQGWILNASVVANVAMLVMFWLRS